MELKNQKWVKWVKGYKIPVLKINKPWKFFFLKEKKRKPALGSHHSNNRQESSMDVKLQGMGYLHHLKGPPTNYLLLIIKGEIADSQETWPKPSQSMIKLSITNKGRKGQQVPLLSRRQ